MRTMSNLLDFSRALFIVHSTYIIVFCPGSEAPGSSVQIERSDGSEGAGTFFKYNPNISLSLQQQKQKLPVFKVIKFLSYITWFCHNKMILL